MDVNEVMDLLRRATAASPDAPPYRQRRAACDRFGHQYQVIGKNQPTGLICKRCLIRWAIGPRTEPREAASS